MGLGAEVEGVFLFPTLLHTLLLINSSLQLVRDREGVQSLFGQWLAPDTHRELLKDEILPSFLRTREIAPNSSLSKQEPVGDP